MSSVPLNRKKDNNVNKGSNGTNPPIWAVAHADQSAQDLEAPLPAKCDRHSGVREGVCCKELKGEDERHLIDPDVIRDV